MEKTVLAILLLAPLVGFLINGLRFRSKNAQVAGVVATSAIFVSFISSLSLFFKVKALPEAERAIRVHFFNWISVGDFTADAAFVVDQISGIMILIITGVGTLIHLFSIGYMSHDERPAKYFAYLNLFVFNMLLLVLGSNLLVMFVGWEGVGLCSYLLIGFWFSDPEKAAAGMKAFITNRIGDAGFLLGIFLLFINFGTIEFAELLAKMPTEAEGAWSGPITMACLFLFVGATGKSAQIPLYVWLPDAMAGPTPVSALIHAATMVTAGVYMIVRMSGVFILAPNVMTVIATIGALTALLAATIGMTQWDIKKILAYSTVSQLGYMFLAVGVGAFMPALFHLMTHAFFKALMFLGSGSVIHAMHEEQDVRNMGGLMKYMPITHITFFMGWWAIIGLPPFAGFFSKDEILWYTWNSPVGHEAMVAGLAWNKVLWFIGLCAAGMTAFYMTRLMALTFWGKSRVPKDVHPHESPLTMTIPLMVLAFLSLVGGWVGIPHAIGDLLGHIPNLMEVWVGPAVAKIDLGHGSKVVEFALMGVSIGVAGISAWLAYNKYVTKGYTEEELAEEPKGFHALVYNKYFVDEAYFGKIINPLVDISKGLWAYFDVAIVDKVTYLLSDWMMSSSDGIRTSQNGNIQRYAMFVAVGLLGILTFILY